MGKHPIGGDVVTISRTRDSFWIHGRTPAEDQSRLWLVSVTWNFPGGEFGLGILVADNQEIANLNLSETARDSMHR